MGSKRVLQGGEKSSPLSVLCDLWLVYRVYGLDGEKWKCGLGREIMVLGQALAAGSVVQGAKLRVWVKHWWREVWSVGRNYGLGSNRPRRSMVQGEKLRPRVTPGPVTPSSHLKYKKESKTNI